METLGVKVAVLVAVAVHLKYHRRVAAAQGVTVVVQTIMALMVLGLLLQMLVAVVVVGVLLVDLALLVLLVDLAVEPFN